MSESLPLFAASVLEDRRERIERFVAALQSRQPRPRTRPPPAPEVGPAPSRPAPSKADHGADLHRRAPSEDCRDRVLRRERGSGPEARPAAGPVVDEPSLPRRERSPRPAARGRSPIVVVPRDRSPAPPTTSPSRERRDRLKKIHLETERRVRELRRRVAEEEAGRRAEREAAEMEELPSTPGLGSARPADRTQTQRVRQRPCDDGGSRSRADRHLARSLLVQRGLAPWKRLVEMARYRR